MPINTRYIVSGLSASFLAIVLLGHQTYQNVYVPEGFSENKNDTSSFGTFFDFEAFESFDAGAFERLESIVAQEIRDFDGEASLVITDLSDGQTFSINGNRKHMTGCTINIFPYLVLMQDVQKGKIELDESLKINVRNGFAWSIPDYVIPILNRIGGSVKGGVKRSNELREELGAVSSVMTHEPKFGNLLDGDNYFTADDANMVLVKLWKGEVLDPIYTRLAIEYLKSPSSGADFIIPRQIPRYFVAHKIGFHDNPDGWVFNDMGIVEIEAKGKTFPFTFTYFSQKGKLITLREAEGNARFHDAEGAKLGAKLAHIAYIHMLQKYGL